MMASTHIGFGMACWLAYARMRGLPFPIEPVPMAIASVGALLPDIDHPNSALGRVIPFISIPVSAIFGHRGVTHSLLAVAGLSIALWYYGGLWFVPPLIIGYLSHLSGDLLCNSGVPLFWPNRSKVVIHLFNTGGLLEGLLRLCIGIFVIWNIWDYAKPLLQTA